MEIPINPGSITMMIILWTIFLAYGKYSYEKDLKNKKNKNSFAKSLSELIYK